MLSIIVPVYNRPAEVRELLHSLTNQRDKDFEVIIIEDGSTEHCRAEVDTYSHLLNLRYVYVPNGGPAKARNIGAELAERWFLVFLDSDVVLPPSYVEEVKEGIEKNRCDAFGGPDAASADFSAVQKAINYAMTSFLTTGGIRGGKRQMDKFYPRSFNLGCRHETFKASGGFSEDMRFGEDIDFSARLFEMGYKVVLLHKAFVFHKRRVDFRKFFRQVHNSGIARIHLARRHPGSTKLVHLLPAVFTIGVLVLLLSAPFCFWALLPIFLYSLLLVTGSLFACNSLHVALLSVPAAFVQLMGYGSGYLKAWWRCVVLNKPYAYAFRSNFYD